MFNKLVLAVRVRLGVRCWLGRKKGKHCICAERKEIVFVFLPAEERREERKGKLPLHSQSCGTSFEPPEAKLQMHLEIIQDLLPGNREACHTS